MQPVIIADTAGNKLITHLHGDNTATVYLKLCSERNQRLIAAVNFNSRMAVINRDRGKHLMFKFNSYGFNHALLSRAKKFDKIMLSDECDMWIVPVAFILEEGKILNFKQRGFEKQIFVTLEQLEDFKKCNKQIL